MGTNIYQTEQRFCIKAANHQKVMLAIKGLAGKETIVDTEAHFYFVRTKDFLAAKTISEIFDAWRWSIDTNYNGDISGINFIGEKLGDDNIFFQAIAPYVEEGSYIQMFNDSGKTWRWCFENGKMLEKYAKLAFD